MELKAEVDIRRQAPAALQQPLNVLTFGQQRITAFERHGPV
jgi:hypothetical protein